MGYDISTRNCDIVIPAEKVGLALDGANKHWQNMADFARLTLRVNEPDGAPEAWEESFGQGPWKTLGDALEYYALVSEIDEDGTWHIKGCEEEKLGWLPAFLRELAPAVRAGSSLQLIGDCGYDLFQFWFDGERCWFQQAEAIRYEVQGQEPESVADEIAWFKNMRAEVEASRNV